MESKADSIHVLVVDDEQDIRDGSERILTRMGYQVSKASRGDQALAILPNSKVSIVLLDLKMPGMDGMEVLLQIRDIDQEILIIVVTGYATVDTAIKAMKLGAYDFIPKPFEPDQLRIVVNRAGEKIRLRQETKKMEQERKRTLADLDTEKSRLRSILESLPDGVVVTNTKGQVVLMNPSFKTLLNLDQNIKSGEFIDAYITDKALCQLIKEISLGKHVDYGDIPSHEISLPGDKFLLGKGQPVLGERNECLGAVVNFVNISDMKLLDRLKSEFMAKVTHELRSPLSTIHEQLALVIRAMMTEPSKQDQHILTRAQEKTKGLISLIGDLLDLSRIEEGRICHEMKPIRIEDIMSSVVDFLKTRADAKKQSLEMQILTDNLPVINADPLALESIFGNLITNAINYTPEGGAISVQIDLAGINLRVKVKDNGFGIDAKHLDKIFERFYRVKDEKTRYITGTGLGLPIVKGLIESMGGLIEVESELGKGTTFTVLIPIDSQKRNFNQTDALRLR